MCTLPGEYWRNVSVFSCQTSRYFKANVIHTLTDLVATTTVTAPLKYFLKYPLHVDIICSFVIDMVNLGDMSTCNGTLTSRHLSLYDYNYTKS